MSWLRHLLMMIAALSLAGTADGQPRFQRATPEQRAAAEAALARFLSPTLTRFAGDDEFRRYLGAYLAAERARNGWYGALRGPSFAMAGQSVQSDALNPICPETDPGCLAAGDDEAVIVTGSRIAAPSNPSITNNQLRGVEEGDIVKQIDRFLLVLQEGRIFVIDTRAGGAGRLALTDRANVYRDRRENIWYDEMLVFGDRVLVTGYSYRRRATELSVFRLDDRGRLAREGVFYVSSNDYFSSTNYATRLIGDNLVIYTPFGIRDMARPAFRWPVVRRWTEGEPASATGGRPLFDAAGIYRPLRDSDDPMVHSVSVCPLGEARGGRELECRTTAFIGPNSAQWLVTETDAFLWTTDRWRRSYDPRDCDLGPDFGRDSTPALVYRVPLAGGPPRVIGARGVPPDQFSLHVAGAALHALAVSTSRECDDASGRDARLAYVELPLAGFGDTLREAAPDRFTRLPGVGSFYVANRFTDRYLVYGMLRGRLAGSRSAFAVPVGRPRAVRGIPLDHTVIRAEQVGGDILVTGYRDDSGLILSVIDLDRAPRVASSVLLDGRFESEGRSHAFNSLIGADGSGLMGLPTVRRIAEDSRAAWRSRASDLSFLSVDGAGRLRHLGELERRFTYADDDADDDDGVPGYACEVSCIDWYGNSRPIFTDGRIFALSGTELIEGRVRRGAIEEVQRLNIALSPPPG